MKLLFAFNKEKNVVPLLKELRSNNIDPRWKRVDSTVAMRQVLVGGIWDAVLFEDVMTGFGVTDALDIMEECGQGAPFIVITEKEGMEPFVSLVKRGVSDFVVKNDLECLASTIERELRCSRLRREISRNEDEIRRLANYDALTNLPNRRLLVERLTHGLKRSKRQKSICSVLFVDLDNFKPVNDALGHHAGDLLLQETARRLLLCTREADTVARTGGDEFVIVLEDVDNENRGMQVADNILAVMETPFDLEGTEATVSASIGISVFPFDGDDAKTLLKKADVAMYQAKSKGRNAFQMFKPGMEAKKISFRQNDRKSSVDDKGKAALREPRTPPKSRMMRVLALHFWAIAIVAGGVFFALWSNAISQRLAEQEMLDFDPNMETSAGGNEISQKKR